MKQLISAAIVLAIVFSCATLRTPKDPVENRIEGLIKELTLEEKVGQTCQVTLDVILKRDAKGNALVPAQVDEALLSEVIDTYKVGSKRWFSFLDAGGMDEHHFCSQRALSFRKI
jgi:hypothetical protein